MARPASRRPASRRPPGHSVRGAGPVLAAALLAVVAWSAAPAQAAELALSADYPLRGQPATVTLTEGGAPLPGLAVEALYRPNSRTSLRESVGVTGADGTVTWVPRDAGIVTLTARSAAGGDALASRNVAVRFGYFPVSGLIIMIIAGLLLFGGAAAGMVLLMRPDRPLPTTEPPST